MSDTWVKLGRFDELSDMDLGSTSSQILALSDTSDLVNEYPMKLPPDTEPDSGSGDKITSILDAKERVADAVPLHESQELKITSLSAFRLRRIKRKADIQPITKAKKLNFDSPYYPVPMYSYRKDPDKFVSLLREPVGDLKDILELQDSDDDLDLGLEENRIKLPTTYKLRPTNPTESQKRIHFEGRYYPMPVIIFNTLDLDTAPARSKNFMKSTMV